MKAKTAKQTSNGGGSSAKINYAVGSGSRPGGARMKIESSAPASKQQIRPLNKIGS